MSKTNFFAQAERLPLTTVVEQQGHALRTGEEQLQDCLSPLPRLESGCIG